MHKTKAVIAREVQIGGGARVSIQSMLNVPSGNIAGNVAQAVRLSKAGCEILRVSIPDKNALALIPAIKKAVNLPLVADIHFDYKLALGALDAGIDKIRINPGNIGAPDRIKAVADACRQRGVPIRIGVNSGSLEKHILQRYGSPSAQALVESAMYHVSLLERFDFTDIVLSIKSSGLPTMVQAYKMAAQRCNYPLHLGVTEAGTARFGTVKSAIGIGALLLEGIGDTIRVSLTDDPVLEIQAARDILKAVGQGEGGITVISCPTCGRTKMNLIPLAKQVEELAAGYEDLRLTLAVMGCGVNGPGEAREADIGIACGETHALLFKKGETIAKIGEDEVLAVLKRELDEIRKGAGK